MSGILQIEYKNKPEELISYYTLQQLDDISKKEKMKSIYNLYRHKQIKISCICSSEPISMSIGCIEKTDTYYLSSFPGQKRNHNEGCYFFQKDSLSSDSMHKKNCEEDENGNFHVALNKHDFKVQKSKKTNQPVKVSNHTESSDVGISSKKLSIQQLIKLIVTTAWNDYIDFNAKKEYPTISHIFNKIYSSSTKKFFVADDINLNKLLFKSGKIGRIYHMENEYKRKYQPFVIFLMNSIERVDDTLYIINVTNPVTKEKYQFSASDEIMEYAKRVRVSIGPFIAGGFVKSTGFGKIPECISLGILPINKYGVPIESSYERELYDLLCEEKRLVSRPLDTKRYPEWAGLVPDGLLVDTDPKTIIEVFGMSENHIDYHLHRKFKIDHFNSLKPSYDFWYWDAFNQSEKPALPLSMEFETKLDLREL